MDLRKFGAHLAITLIEYQRTDSGLQIIEGSITVVVAIAALFVLPDFPTNTKWLSPKEAAVAEWRLIKDAAGQTDEDDAAWSSGFKDAFKDWRTYFFAALFHCVLVLTSVQNFFVSYPDHLNPAIYTTVTADT